MAKTIGRLLTRQILERLAPETPGRDRFKRFFASAITEDIFHWQDEFTGPTINTFIHTVGNGGGALAASPAISVGLKGGQMIMVTGTAGDNTASSVLESGRHFTGDGNAVMTARLNINSAVTAVKVEVGFRNAITTTAGAGNLVNAMATPTFTGTDGAVWCYDTNNALGWQGLGVAATVPATSFVPSSVILPVADTFQTLVVALLDGLAYFMILDADNNEIVVSSTPVAAAVTKTTLQSAHIYVEARGAGSRTVAVDRVHAWAARTTT